MALEQTMMDQPAPEEQAQNPNSASNLSEDEEQDLRIAVKMGEDMLEEGGYDAIKAAMGSKDPAQVIGQFFVMLLQKLVTELPDDVQLSRRIFLAKGGWLEIMMDMVAEELGIDYAITDRAEIYVADTVSRMAKQNAAQAQGGGAPAPAAPAAPAMPQGGMPQ